MFRVLDKMFRGSIGFIELMLADISCLVESDEDKLVWIFYVCDKTAKDVIMGNEVDDTVSSLFALVGIRLGKSNLAACYEELLEIITIVSKRQQISRILTSATKCLNAILL